MKHYAIYLNTGASRMVVPNPDCPEADKHTPCPEGYIAWHRWAEEMSKTHRQRKCKGCGLYSIWEKKDA